MSEIILEPGRMEKQYWRDLWHYRELFFFLAWRDLLVRYKQTFVGVAWAVVRPLVTMVVFTLVFNKLARLESHGVPYPILVFAAMLPWQFFSSALSECGASVVNNANLISKIYFPRVIVPASAVVTSIADFFIALGIMAVLMIAYGFYPHWQVIFLPLFLLLASASALGTGLLLAALTVKYRDFRIVVPFIVQFGLYISPVGFDSSIVPDKWRLLYSLNPMVGVIDGFRWCLIGADRSLYLPALGLSIVVSAGLLWLGIRYFRRTERTFADVI